MKEFALKAIISCLPFILCFMSCQNRSNVATTTIEVNGNLKIAYSGTIKLNSDTTDFKSISLNGYVRYKNRDIKMVVERDNNGSMHYELNGNRKKKDSFTETDKKLVASGIRDMIANGAKF